MNINDIEFPNMDLKVWVMVGLLEPGPWQNKENVKEQVNCLLNLKLSGCCPEAMDIRGYLCNDDTDEVWLNSLHGQVFPFIVNKEPGVLHG